MTEPTILQRVLDAGGELEDDELIVARHLTSAGRSRAYVGGAQVPAPVCAAITEQLIAIHGQSEQQRLAAADRPRQLLDRFAGEGLAGVLSRFRELYAERRADATELARLRAEAQARAREIDLLRFGLEEIERVAPEPGEDVALAAETLRLQSADDLRQAAQAALAAVAGGDDEAGGALTEVTVARKALDGRPPIRSSPNWPPAGRDELSAGRRGGRSARSSTPGRGAGTVGVDRGPPVGARRSDPQVRDDDRRGDRLERGVGGPAGQPAVQRRPDRPARRTGGRARCQLSELAAAITAARTVAAGAFADQVVTELAALAMPHARLAFQLSPAALGPHGADQVELLFSANPGSEPRSLGKVASGGELSRVRLALEVVLAAGQEAGTLVFDEVDAGVGGRVAVEIGRRLARLAQVSQVVVVTHLAQVAAFADRHYVVIKADDGQVTTSGVQLVSDEERAAELARMMAGLETTESALAHAGELVELAAATRLGG